MSRRTFLVLGGVGFAGAVFSSVAGCGGEGGREQWGGDDFGV
jgi:hypothetical protein